MANSLDITFSAAAEVETPNWRTTWGHRAAIASRARLAVRNAAPDAPQWRHYTITITRIGANRLDDDNLISACKPVRDEVAQWLGVDDGSPRMQWCYEQRVERLIDPTPRAKRVYRTWVEIRVSPGAQLEPPAGPSPAAQPYPRGSILLEREGGGGADTPSNNTITPCETTATSTGPARNSASAPPPGSNSANIPGPIPRLGLVRLPPARLERERTRAPTRSDLDRSTPTQEVAIPRPNGSSLRVARLDDAHGTRIRICTHYVQQGHAWRTTGVAVELGEVEALIAALKELANSYK